MGHILVQFCSAMQIDDRSIHGAVLRKKAAKEQLNRDNIGSLAAARFLLLLFYKVETKIQLNFEHFAYFHQHRFFPTAFT